MRNVKVAGEMAAFYSGSAALVLLMLVIGWYTITHWL
jgi:hypothetical protein